MRDRSSKKKLLHGAAQHYPGDGMFDRIGRAVCAAEDGVRMEARDHSRQAASSTRRPPHCMTAQPPGTCARARRHAVAYTTCDLN